MNRKRLWWQCLLLLLGILGLNLYFFPEGRLAALVIGDRELPQLPSLSPRAAEPLLRRGEERFLRNVRQLTSGGSNAEAYWSRDGAQIVFQSTRDDLTADQIFVMDADGSNVRMVSTGRGRTTCGYFSADASRVFYASTHAADPEPPLPPDRSGGYVWPIYAEYQIFRARVDRPQAPLQLTHNDGYDAEATLSPDGRTIVFTSLRDGDLDIYTMDYDGRDLRRLTDELGYDGGPFFSHDGSMICYRAYHPRTEAEIEEYRELLARNLVSPSQVELWVMDADGSNKRQVTRNGAANFAPFFTPDDRGLIFASNLNDPRGRVFDLFTINLDGSGLRQVTHQDGFDSFPMFSPDGTQLLWASDRNASGPGEFDLFVADWIGDEG